MARSSDPLPKGRIRGSDLLIFLSLGTHEQPFDRALELVPALARAEDVVVQHGHTRARRELLNVSWLEFVSYEELVALMRRASTVACHAGVGTIMTALSLGKIPLVMPRLRELNEHVDDHQLQIAAALAKRGLVVSYLPGDDLLESVDAARAGHATLGGGGNRLKQAVRAAVEEPLPSRGFPAFGNR